MKAITKTKYGGPEVLRWEEIEKPKVKEGEVLVKVHANSANPADWHVMRGAPWMARFAFGLFSPKQKVLGSDFAGTVEEVGVGAEAYQVGDRVYGELGTGGAFAEYVSAPADACAHMPEALDFAAMACVPIAGLTALQALDTHGKLQPGESVLINGASGGVGHFAVQIAKAMGASVTAVCSSRNEAFVKSLGADTVLAYDQVDIQQHTRQYSLVLDNHGNLHHRDLRRMGQRAVLIGFTTMGHMMRVMLRQMVSGYSLKVFTAAPNTEDLSALADMLQAGTVKVHVEKTYSSQEIPEAIRYIEGMRTRGKVAMVWDA